MISNQIGRIFKNDKPPFFLTLFFAAVAWSVTRYADSLAAEPVIEYDIRQIGEEVAFDLENLTHNQTFSKLVFLVRIPGRTITQARIVPTQPAWEGSKQPIHSGESARFFLDDFHPGWKFRLKVTAADSHLITPSLQLEHSDKTILLLRPSLETWMIRHHQRLLFILLISWAALTVIALLKGGTNEPTATESNNSANSDPAPARGDVPASSRRRQTKNQNKRER